MATVNNHVFFSTHKLLPPTNPINGYGKQKKFVTISPTKLFSQSKTNHKPYPLIKSIAGDKEVVTEIITVSEVKPDEKNGSGLESGHGEVVVGKESEGIEKFASKAINASIVLGFGTLAVTRLLTIDHEYWHGWTLYEILRYAPEHNWIAYEEALKENPVLAKMIISGIVYSLGDWIAQCYEGKPLFEFDRTRLFRSGLAGFALGSLSHYYYQLCEALIPFNDWWLVPVRIALDQTAWAALFNSIYFVVLGLLRFESPTNIFSELKTTFLPMLTAGWKLWPFAHVVTYGLIPVEQRLLWVDCVELVWITILSTYSNEKSEARISDTSSEVDPNTPSKKH